LETLGVEFGTPNSFYQLLSVIRTFAPIHKSRLVTSIGFVFVDLDVTDGCLMAIQGLYPNSLQYSLVKNLSPLSDLNVSRLNMEATSPQGLASICRLANKRGIALAYCSQMDSRKETVDAVVAGVACLSGEFGTLVVETKNYDSTLFRDLWQFLSTKFSDLVLYKPGVMSCVRKEALIVCRNKHNGTTSDTLTFAQNMQKQTQFLEHHRLLAIQSVRQGVNNQESFDVAYYTNDYTNL